MANQKMTLHQRELIAKAQAKLATGQLTITEYSRVKAAILAGKI